MPRLARSPTPIYLPLLAKRGECRGEELESLTLPSPIGWGEGNKFVMRYVILRDDDTNTFTPVECLEQLYRPFLDRNLPVNLAVIPKVRTDAVAPDGKPEQFLFAKNGTRAASVAIGENQKLARYLLDNSNFHFAQHGYDHSLFEFDSPVQIEIRRKLTDGRELLKAAGLGSPKTFVAPYDRLSRASLGEAANQFRVLSTGWFEWRRLPPSWLGNYARKKFFNTPHWRVRDTILLSHPGCLLSCHRPRETMLQAVKQSVASRRTTVLVTHWWEYFPNGQPDEPFIQILHKVADWLSKEPDLKVVSFDDFANGDVPLN